MKYEGATNVLLIVSCCSILKSFTNCENLQQITNMNLNITESTHMADLVESLQDLNIISSNDATCILLQNFTQTKVSTGKNSYILNLSLHITEVVSVNTSTLAESEQTSTSQQTLMCKKKDHGSSHIKLDNSHLNDSFVYSSENPSDVIHTNKTIEIITDGSNQSMKNSTKEENTNFEKDDDSGSGLNNTQLTVLCTCSIVIGFFFLLSMTLRIRSYIHRLKERKNRDRRPNFRGCSVSLQGDSMNGKDSMSNNSKIKAFILGE